MSNKNKTLQNIKESWQKCYDNGSLNYKFPNENLIKFISPLKKDFSSILDIGSGPENNTKWLRNKKKISIDYCNIKNAKTLNVVDFTIKKNILKKKFINNSELIILNQFLDHIPIYQAKSVCDLLGRFYKKTKYIFVSFLLNTCKGNIVRGEKIFEKSYISKISDKTDEIELHTFYNKKDIELLINKLPDFRIEKNTIVTEKYTTNNAEQRMVTSYYLLKNNFLN